MKLTIKVGEVEIEYSQDTNALDYPTLASRDKCQDGRMRSELMLDTIKAIADKAAEINNAITY